MTICFNWPSGLLIWKPHTSLCYRHYTLFYNCLPYLLVCTLRFRRLFIATKNKHKENWRACTLETFCDKRSLCREGDSITLTLYLSTDMTSSLHVTETTPHPVWLKTSANSDSSDFASGKKFKAPTCRFRQGICQIWRGMRRECIGEEYRENWVRQVSKCSNVWTHSFVYVVYFA